MIYVHWGNYGWGMAHGWAVGPGWLFMFIFLALTIAVVIYLVKFMVGGGKRKETKEVPFDIIKKKIRKRRDKKR